MKLIRQTLDSDIPDIVHVHLSSFQNFFLTFLGGRFLELLYREILQEPDNVCFVAISPDDRIIGFIFGVTNQVGFYKRLAKKKWLSFALVSSKAALRRPSIIPRLFRALRYDGKAKEASSPASLMSIAVAPEEKGKGTGKSLVNMFLNEMAQKGVEKICLTTDRDDNESTNIFYKKLGFLKTREFKTPEGRWMYEYTVNLSAEKKLGTQNLSEHSRHKRLLKEVYGYNLRPAIERDTKRLAYLHYEAAKIQPGAFLHKLGMRFLNEYYRLLIEEGDELILCAVDEADQIFGFISGTYSAQKHFKNLGKKRFRLLLSLSPKILLTPKLLFGIWHRSSIAYEASDQYKYVVTSGCRIEYWAWDPSQRTRNGSVLLLLAFLEKVRDKGIRYVRAEVDAPNRSVLVTHLILGAKVIARFTTPDKRERMILEHRFDNLEA